MLMLSKHPANYTVTWTFMTVTASYVELRLFQSQWDAVGRKINNEAHFHGNYFLLKGDPKWRNTTDPVDRNGIKKIKIKNTKKNQTPVFHWFLVCLFCFLLRDNGWKSGKQDRKCCHFLPSSLYQWRHEQDRHVWWKYQKRHEQTLYFLFFQSSPLVKSESTWLRPGDSHLKPKTKR